MAIEAGFMDESDADPRLPHHRSPREFVPSDHLAEVGVLYWRWNPRGYGNDQQLREIRETREYNYMDMLDICPEKLESYEEKLKNFYTENIHADEEIRYCFERSGHFDIRGKGDLWIRVWIEAGDLIILPAGIYHRFTPDTTNYAKEHPEDVFQAYRMYDSDEDQRLPRFRFSNDFLVQLAEHESLSCTLNPDSYRRDEELKKIHNLCGYSNLLTNVCPEKLPNGKVKGTNLSETHFHTDELIRRRINYSRICSCLPAVHVGKSAFHMDDGVLPGTCELYAKGLLLSARKEFEIFSEEIITEAFYQAEQAHRGQMRANSDPYIHHCLETAKLLASLGANSTVVAAGILHDTLDDSFMCYDCIFGKFGAEIADLVEWVSVISDVSKLARVNNTASKRDEAVGLHTMVLSRADIRAVIIKLADRLHNMRTLDALPLDKQKRVAKETMEIFVPLANRLGISNWKVQLETLCFKHLNPGEYNELRSKLVHSFDEAIVTSAAERLERALKDEAIFYHDVYGRNKSWYSIHCKMSKKNLKMDQIHDIHGIRAIVEDEKDCYGAIRVVHQLWPEVPGKFKDYIAQPQSNGYQFLHTVVLVQGKVKLEVQIRTRKMHLHAEFGFAAHWRYKEGDYIPPSSVLQIVEWARWVVACHCGARSRDKLRIGSPDSIKPPCMFRFHTDDCPHSYKPQDCGQDEPVFVMIIENDKMSVQKFCADYTIMHLLVERARQGICWWEEPMPMLNNEPVRDPTCKLQMGDVVELTPAIPEKSLTEYRDEIHRIYEREMRLLGHCDAGQSPFAFLEHSD